MPGPLIAHVAGALATASQSTTLALANINFNFELWKREVPLEYEPLRAALSERRLEDAEVGKPHAIARKLGALFGPLLPKTPSLYRAYGIRASEIATQVSDITTPGQSHGPFAEYAGVDGTSILAAATSGDEAIAVHLLACMLARQFSPAVATAAWEGIVLERTTHLRDIAEKSTMRVDEIFASRIEVSHAELASWDASARAWRDSADRVQYKRQKQLMLILENLQRAPMEGGETAFASILPNWCTAMDTMEKIINGAAHVVQSAPALLAISAWHLYPDITVLGMTTKHVLFEDSLIAAGGSFTVGIVDEMPSGSKGIYWSLPLSRLRYYGDVEVVERVLGLDTSHVPYSYFEFVAMGSASIAWVPKTSKIDEIANFFIVLNEYFEKQCSFDATAWPSLLARIATTFLSLSGSDRQYASRLIKLGQRQHVMFYSHPHRELFSDDTNKDNLLSKEAMNIPPMQLLTHMVRDEGHKIKLLQFTIESKLAEHADNLIIRVTLSTGDIALYFARSDVRLLPHNVKAFPEHYLKQLVSGHAQYRKLYMSMNQPRAASGYVLDMVPQKPFHRFMWMDPPRLRNPPDPIPGLRSQHLNANEIKYNETNQILPQNPPADIYQFLYGDDQVAIFARESWKINVPRKMLGLREIQKAFEAQWVDVQALLERMGMHVISLRAFSSAACVFEGLKEGVISLEGITKVPLGAYKWVDKSRLDIAKVSHQRFMTDILMPKPMSRAEKFSCVALFVTGTLDLPPGELETVMAISSGDSLYVSKALLSDPTAPHATEDLVRLPGNISRPGTAFLVSPAKPKTGISNPAKWAMVAHEDFDGKIADNFSSTNLLMSFTDYERPVGIPISGGKFVDAYFIESVVSLVDAGKRVADLDVLAMAGKIHHFQRSSDSPSHCTEWTKPPDLHLTSIDSIDEFMNRPESCMVVRASNNWLARLALATISAHKGYDTLVLPTDLNYCWHDVVEDMAKWHKSSRQVIRLDANSIVEESQMVFIQ